MKTLIALTALIALNLSAASLLQKATQRAAPLSNPYAQDESAVLAGQKIFAAECAACHGAEGNGRGRPKTPILASPYIRNASPGALFWILRNGSPNHRMPSFSHLPEQQRWQIIRYLQRPQ